MKLPGFIATRRARLLLVTAVAVLLAAGITLSLIRPTPPPASELPFEPYSERYNSTLQSINSSSGEYRERDYSIATYPELTMPSNGAVLINPIPASASEEEVPGVISGSYSFESDLDAHLYTRLSNSSRSDGRIGAAPEAAILSLDYTSTREEVAWRSLTLYNNASAEELVDSALIFAPSSTQHTTDWQNNASLYLLDGEHTSHAAALLPGVNILNASDEEGRAGGVVYTNRQLAIGGLPRMWQDELALVALEEAASRGELENIDTLRMDVSQRITGTDLIFDAPADTWVASSIQAPVSESLPGNSFTLSGGVIAVNERATLNVGSGEIGYASSLAGGSIVVSEEDENDNADEATRAPVEGSITLAPRAIIVDGGTLILSDTTQGGISINASIQVRNGGTLQIGNNVVINGNIYAFGGGRVEVKGNFVLNGAPVSVASDATQSSSAQTGVLLAQAEESPEQIPGGIFILADSSVDVDGASLGAGSFEAQLLWMVRGNDGLAPLAHSRAVHFFTVEPDPPGYPLMYRDYACQDASPHSHICEHTGPIRNGQASELRVAFSEDGTLVDYFMLS